MHRWLVLVVLVPLLAHAAPSRQDVTWTLTNRGDDDSSAVKFGFDQSGVHASPKSWDDADTDRIDLIELDAPTIATAADGKAVWVATHARRAVQCAGLTGTVKQCGDPKDTIEVTLLYEQAGKKWRPVAVHSAHAMTDADAAKAAIALDAIPKRIGPDAQAAVDVFTASLADPKAFAASVSDRKDAVLTGSGPGEKYVGGAKLKATLQGWKLAFTVHDGIAAGTTASKSVAWVAANLDARPVGKPDAKPTAYRALMLYEHEGSAWRLVAAQFSVPRKAPTPE